MSATVRLRPATREDLPQRVAWMNDYDVTEFTGRDAGESTLEEAQEKFAARTDPDWTIEVEGRAIGMCGLHLDQGKQNAGFGIVIGEKDCWGRGYGTAALREVLRVAFEEMKLHRVYLHAFPGNARGLRCYEKCGFRQEGLLVQAHWKRGRWLDVIPMAILKTEWEGLVARRTGLPQTAASDEVIIRDYRTSDYSQVKTIWEAAGWSEHNGSTEEAVTYKLLHSRGPFLIADISGRVVGTAMVSWDGRWGWVSAVAVHPDYRRRGVAQRLMAAAERALTDLGAYQICLLANNQDAAATGLYRGLGYESFDFVTYMRKKLTPGRSCRED